MLCGDLDGWDGGEAKKEGIHTHTHTHIHTHIHIANALCRTIL